MHVGSIDHRCSALRSEPNQAGGPVGSGFLLGAEPAVGQLIITKLQGCDLGSVKRAAVEDEHQRVIPGTVRTDPIDHQQVCDVSL